jgi:phosphate acetyltransferase
MWVHHSILDRVIEKCRDLDPTPVAIVSPLSEVSLTGAVEAARARLVTPYLVGPGGKVASLARDHRIEIAAYPIVDVADDLDTPSYPRTLIITDAAINIHPKLEDKVDIIQNAIDFAHLLGLTAPKVAILSAIETASSKLASTIDTAALCKMAEGWPDHRRYSGRSTRV